MKGERCIKIRTSLPKTFLLCLFVFFFSLFSALLPGFSHNASAISLTNPSSVNITFRYTLLSDGQNYWRRNVPTGTLAIPQTLVSYNTQRGSTYLMGLGVGLNVLGQGNSSMYYNQYRFGITLRQTPYSAGGEDLHNTIDDNLGRYSVSMDGETSTGASVHTDDCGYEIGYDFISHICYFDLEAYQTLRSVSWNLGDHSTSSIIDYLGNIQYMYMSGNQDLRLTDLTLLVQTSDNPLISGQQQLINNTTIINNNVVDIKNQLSDLETAINDPAWFRRIEENFEDTSSDVQDGINDNQDISNISTKTTNLLSIITGFVNAISSPVGSTCILPIDLRNYRGAALYDVDLCHLSPPAGITNVLNVAFLFFVLALAVSAVRMIIQLYNEVTRN